MSKCAILETYTNEGAAGMVGDTSDRRAAMETVYYSVGV